MANTRTSAKRARQAVTRQRQNQAIKGATKSKIKRAMEALNNKAADTSAAATQLAYKNAVRALSKAASKGTLPKKRAARKISRLTRLAQKTRPEVFQSQGVQTQA